MLEIRRDLTAELIGAHDVDAPVIEIDGKPHRRVLRAAQTYMTDDDSQPAVSPVEVKLGVVDFWSPKAAKQALWLVARMTPQAAERATDTCDLSINWGTGGGTRAGAASNASSALAKSRRWVSAGRRGSRRELSERDVASLEGHVSRTVSSDASPGSVILLPMSKSMSSDTMGDARRAVVK